MSDWKKLTDTVEYQQGWSPRDTMENKTLRKFSKTCEYFDISDKIDAAIAIIDGYLYLVIDWERGDTLEDPIEHTEKTVAFRITGGV